MSLSQQPNPLEERVARLEALFEKLAGIMETQGQVTDELLGSIQSIGRIIKEGHEEGERCPS